MLIEAVVSFAVVVGLASAALEASNLTGSPKQILLESEKVLKGYADLLVPVRDLEYAIPLEQAEALIQSFAERPPSTSSLSELQAPGEALSVIADKPNLLVAKAKATRGS